MDEKTEAAMRLFAERIAPRDEVVSIILFGSRARNTHRADSDADVAVLLKGTHGRFLSTKLSMADIAFDVLLETGIRIQPLPVWEDQWQHPETFTNPALLQAIVRDGVRL